MTVDNLSLRVSKLSLRLEALQAMCKSSPASASEILSDALDSLQSSLEELSSADEEIIRQNEALLDAKSALQESEERYRTLFNSMTEGFALHEIICDEKGEPYDYRFLDVNPAFENLTGLKREDVIGRTQRDILPGEDPRWVREYGAVALTGVPARFENYAQVLGKHYEVFAYRPAPRQFAVMFTDITERKRSEAALRQSQEKYHQLVEGSGSVILLADRDMRITFMNQYGLQFFGYSPEEIIGKRALGTIIPAKDDEGHDIAAMAEDLMQYPDNYPTNAHQNMRKDGSLVWMSWTNRPIYDDQGNLVELLAIGNDLSGLMEAAEALARSNRKIIETLESIQDGFFALDHGWHFTYLNRRAGKNIGLEPEDLIGQNLWERFPRIVGTEHETAYRKAMDDREMQRFEMRGVLTDRWYSVAVYPSDEGISVFWQDITERKRMEEELKISEEKSRLLIKYAPSAIYEIDFHGPKFVSVNDAMCSMLGYTRVELMAKNPLDILEGESKNIFRERMMKHLAGETLPDLIEYSARAKDGRILYGILNVSFTYDGGRPAGAVVVAHDITERKLAEAELGRTKERLVLAQKAGRVGTFEWNGTATGAILTEGMGPVYGNLHEEITSKYEDWRRQVHPEDIERVEQRIADALAGKAPYDIEYRICWPGGSVRWVQARGEVERDNQGRPTRMIGVNMDITERKLAEEALHQSEERFRIALQNSPITVATLDRNLRYTWAYHTRHGFQPEQVLGKRPDELIPPEDAAGQMELLQRVLETGVPERREVSGKTKGITWVFDFTVEPMLTEQGGIAGLNMAAIDITERKWAEDELRRARDELEERVQERTAELSDANENLEVINEELSVEISEHENTEKNLMAAKEAAEAAVEAKAAFLANMSHELRTPLNAVIGYSSLLLDDSLTQEQRENIEAIKNGGEALLAIISDVLEFSRAEKEKITLEHQPFSLRRCVEESMDMVAVQADRKGLNLSYTVGYGTLDTIIGDPGRLRQILVNLLSNAVKFTDVGDVSISVFAEALEDNKRRITFEVRDTGIGMPQDKMDRLFEPFTQLEYIISRKRDGAGLRLAISRKLVELMGGEIWSESEEGKGSTFRFTVLAETAPGKHSDYSDAKEDDAHRKLSEQNPMAILVAEDNPSNQKVLVEMLKRLGYRPDAVADGVEVLQALKIRHYDLIFMDIRMPEMDGLTAAKEIRRLMPDNGPKIVAVTAFAMEGDREKCLEAGMDGYIAKPVKLGDLEDVLSRYQPSESSS